MPADHGMLANRSIAGQALTYIDAFYVDPKRIEAQAMLESAFRALESQYPEVIVDQADDKKSVAVRARGFDRTFDLSDVQGTRASRGRSRTSSASWPSASARTSRGTS